MDVLVTAAETVLRRHAAPALRLSELLDHVRADTGARGLEESRLRGALELHPDRFRLLDPWRGPWRFVRGQGRGGPHTEPWVVLVGDPGGQTGEDAIGSATERRLRDSVRWLALTLDTGSSRAVTRWHSLVMAERRARARLGDAA